MTMTREALGLRIVSTGFALLWVVSGALAQGRAESSGAALGRQGWDAIRAGQITEASRLFHDAITENAHDATLFLGAGLAAHLQGQEMEARTALQEAVRLNPKLTAAALLLGDITYRMGDLETAVRTYEAALEVEPNNAQIQGRLESWRKEAALHGGFQRTLSPHFTVLFEGPAEQRLAAAAVDALEAAYWRIGTALLAYPPTVITVVLYTDEQFRDITRSPAWAGGVFDGKIRVPMRGALNDPRQLEKVLAHEFTHALIKSLAPRGVPTWVDEGLAVVFEMGDVKWAERLARRAPSLVPLPRLHDGFLSLPADQVPLAYAESALAVQMLIERGGIPSLTALLQDLAEGQEFTQAFERRVFLSYPEFLTLWARRVRE
ncbi:MAG TPA: tetratricopeptide repeat protein [Candidatus Binatia bacterium]|nr:tetratricopeptide repeat protein [Candidatus Binatia bacterium]